MSTEIERQVAIEWRAERDRKSPLKLATASTKAEQRLIKSSAQFVAGFIPPDYIVDGLLQQGFLYSLTGQTGS
jgi:hypothetical protein